jgi:hypothetical protein
LRRAALAKSAQNDTQLAIARYSAVGFALVINQARLPMVVRVNDLAFLDAFDCPGNGRIPAIALIAGGMELGRLALLLLFLDSEP